MLSPSDTAIVFVLALLLFGPEQLPKIARQLGEAMRHVQNTTHTFMQEMERAAEPADVMEPLMPMPVDIPGDAIAVDASPSESPADTENLSSGHAPEAPP